MGDVTLSYDKDGRLIADLDISIDVRYLDDQYQWLLARTIDSEPEKIPIEVNQETGKVELNPALEGLMNFLEDIRCRVDETEKEAAIEAERQDYMEEALQKRDEAREAALDNHFDMREHYEEM